MDACGKVTSDSERLPRKWWFPEAQAAPDLLVSARAKLVSFNPLMKQSRALITGLSQWGVDGINAAQISLPEHWHLLFPVVVLGRTLTSFYGLWTHSHHVSLF